MISLEASQSRRKSSNLEIEFIAAITNPVTMIPFFQKLIFKIVKRRNKNSETQISNEQLLGEVRSYKVRFVHFAGDFILIMVGILT